MDRCYLITHAAAWISVLAIAALSSAASAAPQCEQVCLHTVMDTYLDSMIAHKPAALPKTNGFRFTENGVEIPIGEGL